MAKILKKETQEQMIARIVKENAAKTSVTGYNFVGIQFDAKAVNAIEMIAEGVIQNAKTLKSLAKVLRASNVNVECLLKLEGIK